MPHRTPPPPPLPRDFYARPVLTVARELLGMHLAYAGAGGSLRGGRIVEVEAYGGPEDRASHARLVRRRGGAVPTERSALMFGAPGVSYIYLIYGLHHCFNAVAHEEGAVGAVLVRALEPWPESALGAKSCAGPARLCAALGLSRGENGLDLCAGPPLYLFDGGTPVADDDVVRGPRIGVDYAGEDALLPHRLCDRRSAALSRRP